MDILCPDRRSRGMALRPIRPQDPGHGKETPSWEEAMYERDDIDRREEQETRMEHAPRCGCLECDPDFYFERAERDAAPGEERCAA
jgi:hypothetical protein